MLDLLRGTVRNLANRLNSWAGPATNPQPETPVAKSVEDWGDIAIGPVGPYPTPAQWLNDRNELVKHYRNSVYIAVGAIARKIASGDAQVFVKRIEKSGIKLEPVSPTHPLERLFDYVNPFFTQYDLWFHVVAWRLITGDSYLWKAKNGLNVPAELWPLPSQWVWAIPSRTEFISQYLVRAFFGMDTYLPRDEVVHFREPTLDWSDSGRFYGRPPLVAGAHMVDNEDAMLERLRHEFKNYAPPAMVYSTEQQLTQEQLKKAYAQILHQHSRTENSGKPIIAHSGFKANKFSANADEMNYSESIWTALEYILAIYGVPKAVVGLTENVNKASMAGAMIAFVDNVVNPLLVHIGQHLTQDLAHDFDENLVVQFPPFEVEDAAALRENVKTASGAGAMTPNEIREELLGKGPYKTGGDMPLVSPAQVEAQFGNAEPATEEEGVLVTEGAAVAGEEKIADQAMTGIQTTSMVGIAEKVVAGALPPEAAREMFAQAFPTMPTDRIERIVQALIAFRESEDAKKAEQVAQQPQAFGNGQPDDGQEGDMEQALRKCLAIAKADYAAVLLVLPVPLQRMVRRFGISIPDQYLTEDGREEKPHITLKYGLHSDDPAAVAELLSKQPPITVTLGKTSTFTHGHQSVLKIDVHGAEIHRLHALLGKSLANTELHPRYQPHITVAYLQPDAPSIWSDNGQFDGMMLTFDTVLFSSSEGDTTVIKLGGKPGVLGEEDEQLDKSLDGLVPRTSRFTQSGFGTNGNGRVA